MIEQAILFCQSIIETYGAWGVFLATIIEEVVAPIPSAMVPLAAGFFLLPPDASFALAGFKALFVVAVPVTMGISLASAAIYALAYYGGKPLIIRSRHLTGLSWRDVEKIEQKVSKGRRDEITLFVLRIIPIIPGLAVSAFCGVVRYPFSRFLAITIAGSGVRAFALALLGWQAGEFYLKYLDLISEFEEQIFVVVAILIVALGLAYYFWARKRGARN